MGWHRAGAAKAFSFGYLFGPWNFFIGICYSNTPVLDISLWYVVCLFQEVIP